jgi:MFS family permease
MRPYDSTTVQTGPATTNTPEGPAGYPPPAYAWYVVTVLLVLYVGSFLDRTVISLIVEPIKADLGVSDTAISLLQGLAFALFYSVLGVPLGWLADNYSRRTIVGVGAALWALMAGLCGLTQTYAQLFVARVAVGVGEATLAPSAYSLISDYFPRERLNRAYAVFMLGGPVGGALAFIIGGAVVGMADRIGGVSLPLVGEIRPWQLVFLITGLPGLLLAALMFTVREPVRRGLLAARRAPGQGLGMADAWRYLAAHRRVYGLLLAGFSLAAMLATGFLSWIAVFFIRTYGWTAAQTGAAFGGVALIGGSAGIIAGSFWCDRLVRRGKADAQVQTSILATSLAIPVAIAMPLMPTAPLALSLSGLLVFLFTFPQGTNVAAFQLITPNEFRAQVSAVFLFAINLCGLGLGATVVALFTDYLFGDPAAVRYSLALTAAVTGLPAVIALVLARAPYRASMARANAFA